MKENYDYISETLDANHLIDSLFNLSPIHFEIDELKEIQSGDNPFSYEEILDLLDEELKKTAEEINYSAVEYYLRVLFD